MPFRRRIRARYEWTGNTSVTPTSVAVNTIVGATLLNQATLEEWPKGTLVRLVGNFFVSPATAPAAATGYGVFMGLFWQQQASSPDFDPEINLDAPWKWWHCMFPQIGGTAAADSNASRWIGYFPVHLDLKSVRKRFDDFSQLRFVFKNSNSSGAAIQFSFAFRYLIRAGR